jgi:hypothetical protein
MDKTKLDPVVGESFYISFVSSFDKGETKVCNDLAVITLSLGNGSQYKVVKTSIRIKRDRKNLPFPRFGEGPVSPPPPILDNMGNIGQHGSRFLCYCK